MFDLKEARQRESTKRFRLIESEGELGSLSLEADPWR